jgi:hypothetical protein
MFRKLNNLEEECLLPDPTDTDQILAYFLCKIIIKIAVNLVSDITEMSGFSARFIFSFSYE